MREYEHRMLLIIKNQQRSGLFLNDYLNTRCIITNLLTLIYKSHII
jgi:hypothetical protein